MFLFGYIKWAETVFHKRLLSMYHLINNSFIASGQIGFYPYKKYTRMRRIFVYLYNWEKSKLLKFHINLTYVRALL